MPAPLNISEQFVKYFFTDETVADRPASWEVSLHTGLPSLGGNEVVDGNYSRQPVTLASSDQGTYWEASNEAPVSFPAADVGANFTVTHFAIWDAVSGGMLGQAAIPAPVAVVEGTIISFPINYLKSRGV